MSTTTPDHKAGPSDYTRIITSQTFPFLSQLSVLIDSRMLGGLESSVPSDMPDLRASTHHLLPLTLNTQMCMYVKGRTEGRIGVQDTPETPCLRANRTRFRHWLSKEIPIQWNKRVKSVENTDDKLSVHFEDGTTATGDILVGADGVNSVGM
jgi:flavin-dependent dehydrogenase